MKKTWRARAAKAWREWGRPVLVAAVLVGTLRSAIADWNDVPTGSMKPTILEGDRIFVNKLAYDLRVPFTDLRVVRRTGPKRGDVVVFFSPNDETRMVKRVIGVPGDRIELRNNHLLVNGAPAAYEELSRDIVTQMRPDDVHGCEFAWESIDGRRHPVMLTPPRQARKWVDSFVVPKGMYFVMGDNRDNSFDSRYFGMVERRRIVGEAVAVAASLDPKDGFRPRWGRFFRKLP